MMLKQIYGATISRLIIVFTLLATLQAPQFANAQLEDNTSPDPALWKISDADSAIYLFGTIHILHPTLAWRSEKVTTAFNSAPIVYFEAPADQSNPQAMQALVREHGLNKPGVTLSGQLSVQGQENLKSILSQFGISAAAANFESFRPWLAGVSLAGVQIQSTGGDPNAGVERILSAEAKTAGKDIRYFESDAQQLGFFGNMSPAAEVHFFEAGLQQMLDDPDMLDDLVEVWLRGDIAGVDALMLSSFEGQPELYETLLVNRNADWAQQIDTLMKGSGTVFIAVGAAHLAGEQSVQALLLQHGHTAVRQ